MQVASLELCKELYELSGWEPGDLCYVDSSLMRYGEYIDAAGGRPAITPAYDLGYLLRKLPKKLPAHSDLKGSSMAVLTVNTETDDKWWASYEDIDDSMLPELADTPEDAACKLAIELFKQNILTREQ